MAITEVTEIRLVNEGDQLGPSSGTIYENGIYEADIHLIRNGIAMDLYPKVILQCKSDDNLGFTYKRATDPSLHLDVTISIVPNLISTSTVGIDINNTVTTSWKIKALTLLLNTILENSHL